MDREELEKLFDACDEDGKGFLEHHEFARLCVELNLQEEELRSLFNSVDLNKDGIIQKQEFVAKFHVVADLYFNALDSGVDAAEVEVSNVNNANSNNNNGTVTTQSPDCSNQQDDSDILTQMRDERESLSSISGQESSFLATSQNQVVTRRTSTPRPGASRRSRVSRISAQRAKRINSWDRFAESMGHIIYALPSYDSICTLYKHLDEEGHQVALSNLESMLGNMLKDIEKLQGSVTELEGSLQRVTDKSSEQLSLLEEEMEAQISIKEEKAREEERRRLDGEMLVVRGKYEERIAHLQEAVNKLRKVDERLAKVSPLEREVEKLREKLRLIAAENANLANRLTESETEAVLLKTQVAALEVELQEKTLILNRENDVVRSALTEQESMTKQVHSLTTNNRKLRDSNDDLLEVLESKMAAYNRLSTHIYRSPSAGQGAETLSQYSSAPQSRQDMFLPSGRSSRASFDSDALAACDPKLSSIITEEGASHGEEDDDTEADFSFKSSLMDEAAPYAGTNINNGFEHDSGIGTVRGDDPDTDTEVDGSRGIRRRFSARLAPEFSASSPRVSVSRRSSARLKPRVVGRRGDVTDDDEEDDDDTDDDDGIAVPSSEKKIKYDVPVPPSSQRNSRRKITPNHTMVNGKLFKIILCGDMNVGKSSFIFRTCKDEFNRHTRSTLGVDFQQKALLLDSDEMVTLQLWDTAGQERFRSIAASYFRRADAVILLYDVTHQDSFLNVREWMETISCSAPEDTPVMICGNKVDLRDSLRHSAKKNAVYQEEGAQLAANYGVLFMECSAASGLNVINAVTLLARHLASRARSKANTGSITDLSKPIEHPPDSKCCLRH